jgi:amino acid permease
MYEEACGSTSFVSVIVAFAIGWAYQCNILISISPESLPAEVVISYNLDLSFLSMEVVGSFLSLSRLSFSFWGQLFR